MQLSQLMKNNLEKATEDELTSSNNLLLQVGNALMSLPADKVAKAGDVEDVESKFENSLFDETITTIHSTGDPSGFNVKKGIKYKLYAKCTSASASTIYIFGTRVGTDATNYITTCTAEQLKNGFECIYECNVNAALYVSAAAANKEIEVKVSRMTEASLYAYDEDVFENDDGEYYANSSGLIPTFSKDLKEGYSYKVYFKAPLTSSSTTKRPYFYKEINGSLTPIVGDCSLYPSQVREGVEVEIYADSDFKLRSSLGEARITATINIKFSRFSKCTDYEFVENSIKESLKYVDSGTYHADSSALLPDFKKPLKNGVTYKIDVKSNVLVSYSGSIDVLWILNNDGSLIRSIASCTAQQLYDGFSYEYTATQNCVLGARARQSNVDLNISLTYSRLETFATEEEVKDIEDKIGKNSQWDNKTWAVYGDSITAISNGNTLSIGWAKYVNEKISFSSFYGRGIGSQKFAWGNAGGCVAFVDETNGSYNSHNLNYNKDNYTGSIPSGCVAIRGCFCSWDRITHMFPASIKDTVDVVCIMGGTNDLFNDTEAEFVSGKTTDTEWASSGSDYYGKFNGDYNIETFKGGIASAVLKFQAWMPNAVIVICSPLSGRGATAGQKSTNLNCDEFQKVAVVKEMAERTSCPCIDVYGNCGISPFNRDLYITDLVHPYGDAGKKMLARAFVMGLKNIEPMY